MNNTTKITKSTPAQCRKVIGKTITIHNARFNKTVSCVIESVCKRRHSVFTTTGAEYDYTEFEIVSVDGAAK